MPLSDLRIADANPEYPRTDSSVIIESRRTHLASRFNATPGRIELPLRESSFVAEISSAPMSKESLILKPSIGHRKTGCSGIDSRFFDRQMPSSSAVTVEFRCRRWAPVEYGP